MKVWQERVILEKKELDEKLIKLLAFILSQDFLHIYISKQKGLLKEQYNTMMEYSEILRDRISGF